MLPLPAAVLAGQSLFGDTPSFYSYQLNNTTDSAVQVDNWLGNTPGTTQYGVQSGGRIWLVSGLFIGDSPTDIANQQSLLMSYAGITATVGLPTGYAWPQDFKWWKGGRFNANEVVLGSTTSYAGNRYQAPFKMIIRQIGFET